MLEIRNEVVTPRRPGRARPPPRRWKRTMAAQDTSEVEASSLVPLFPMLGTVGELSATQEHSRMCSTRSNRGPLQ